MRAITAYRFWNLISSNSRKGGIVATRGKRPAQQELDRRDFGTCWRIEDDGIFLNATRRDLELLNVDELDSVTLGMGMRALTKPLVAFPCSIGELDNFLLSLGEAGIGADDYAELFRQDGAITYADDLPDDAYISLFNWIRVMAERTGARRGIEPWSNEGIALLTEFGSHVEEQADTLPLHLLNSKVPASKPFDFTLDDYCIRKDEGAKWLCIDKATAVRMYDKVQAHWKAEITRLKAALGPGGNVVSGDSCEALLARVHLMETTDMAVVVSQGQNEVEDLAKKGLDITPHRRRMLKEHLDEKFKDEADNLRLVFVCAMWITGFDVPTCSTIYLDKPMRAHTLMQTIARANRVAPGKESGLIVDYVGIFRALQDALAVYANPGTGGQAAPILDKAELVQALRNMLREAQTFAAQHGVALDAIVDAQGFTRIGLIADAVEAFLVTDADKKHYLRIASQVARLFKAILPDPLANALAPMAVLVSYLAAKIRAETGQPDISAVMDDVEELLNDSIATEGYHIGPAAKPEALINLSEIDFKGLQEKFQQGHKHTEAQKLRRLLESKLGDMVRQNPARVDLAEKFQALIDAYNAGSKNIEELFADPIYRDWLPESGEELRDQPLFFHYLSVYPETPLEQWQTDIYIPLA